MNDSGILVALDPSVRSSGVALFVNGRLEHAERVTMPVFDANDAVRCATMAQKICAWVGDRQVTALAFERPVIYPPPRGKGDPNKLMMMWGIDLAVMVALSIRFGALEVSAFTPAEWCGGIPKTILREDAQKTLPKKGEAWTSPRGIKIQSRLTITEITACTDQHDAVDAVGIGLHALGRLGVRRVLTSS